MPMINLFNQTALVKSTDQNTANLINLYLEEDQDQGKYSQANGDPVPYVAYPTPGLTSFSGGVSTIRALWEQNGTVYAVDGSAFVSIGPDGTRAHYGDLNTSSGWAKIRGTSSQIFIADDHNGYYLTQADNSFHTISNSGNSVTAVDITAAGSGYTTATTVTFTGGGGTGAAGTVTVSGGQIISVTMTNYGANYASAPTVAFVDASGSGATATAIISPNDFPTDIQDINCQDDFGMVLDQNSQVWRTSGLADLSTWPSLSFASTTGSNNFNVAIESLYREVYIFGTTTTEVWDNVGTANFSFAPNAGVFIEWGCAARESVAKGNSCLCLLAEGPDGGYNVVQLSSGYTPKRVSTRAIEYQISTYSTVSDAKGFLYMQAGHEFYVLTFPTAHKTWVYDITTGQWHERQSLISGNQVEWRAQSYCFGYNKCLVGDFYSGKVYYLDPTTNTDDGAAITRTFVSHPFYSGGWIYVSKLQVDFDNSPGPDLSNWTLYVSRDGGRTFGSGKPAVVQQDAWGMYRVYWGRLGAAHGLVLKLVTSNNMNCTILGAWANISLPPAT